MSRRRLFRIGSASGDGAGPAERRLEELDDEIRAHLEMRIEALMAEGWSREDAEAEAVRRFGPLDDARASLVRSSRARDRRLRVGAVWDTLRADGRLAARRLRRSPGFTGVALVTLALGIGLTTAMFAAVDQVLLRPLPFPDTDRLVTLMSQPEQGEPFPWVSSANWLDWRESNRTLEATALYQSGSRPIVEVPGEDGAGEARRVRASRVTSAFFDVLRPPLAAGRAVAADEVTGGAAPALVSEAFWRRELGAPPLPVELRVGERSVPVVGVVRAGAAWPADTELWLPEAIDPARVGARTNINWNAVARLRPDASLDRARADLDGVAAGIRDVDPSAIYSFGVGVEPFDRFVVDGARDRLLLLLGAVALVLVVVCLNVTGLSAARTLRRAPETSVRVALGAGRSRIVGESLTEHGVLAAVGGGLGLLVTVWVLDRLQLRAADLFPRGGELVLDLRTLGAWGAITVLSGAAAGLVPAWKAARAGPYGIAGRARGGASALGRTGAAMVVGEVATALALLVGGTLLIRSFLELTARDTGFDPRGVAVAEVILDRPAYAMAWQGGDNQAGAAARLAYWEQAVVAAAALPGVTSVAYANALPTYDGGTGFVEIEGLEYDDQGAVYRVVGGEYFRTLGIALQAGRVFDTRDGPSSDRVAVINRTMAERYWPDAEAVGRRIRARSMEAFGGEAPWITVIGVVDDVREGGYDLDVRPQMYVLAAQVPPWMGAMQLAVDVGDQVPGSVRPALLGALRGVDPSLPVTTSALEDRVAGWVSERLFLTILVTGFGGLALVLAGIGVYGLLSFVVSTRIREFGIRAALGADRGTIVGEVVRRSLTLTVGGLAVGALGAWAGARALQSQLVDVAPTDGAAYAVSMAVILFAALAAALLPALRASRVDPVEALRAE